MTLCIGEGQRGLEPPSPRNVLDYVLPKITKCGLVTVMLVEAKINTHAWSQGE